MAKKIFTKSGLLIKPLSVFDGHILFDYLYTTTYKWLTNSDPECASEWIIPEHDTNEMYFLIEDFEFNVHELKEKLRAELGSQSINADFFINE